MKPNTPLISLSVGQYMQKIAFITVMVIADPQQIVFGQNPTLPFILTNELPAVKEIGK